MRHRRLWLTILILFLGLGAAGCANQNAATPEKPAVYDLGVGLFGRNQGGSSAAASLRYSLAAGTVFKADYVTDTQTGGTKLMVIALDNGRQIDFDLNGVTAATHTIIPLAGSHTFSAVFGPFDDGLHNIVVIAIADPDNHRFDEASRQATETKSYPTKVLSLSIGDSSTAAKPAAAVGGASVPDSDYGNVALAPTDVMKLTTWTQQAAQPGQQIDCFIHLGNPSTARIPYTLSVLMDGRQVQIAAGVTAVSGTMVAGQRLILPVKITAPNKAGTYELMAVAGINPFVRQPKTADDKNTTFYLGSARTALIVK